MLKKIKEKIVKFLILGRLKKMLDKLRGFKTYIVAGVGILVALVGVLFGPIDVAGVSIPNLDWDQFFKIAWEGLMIIFLRKGVAGK